MKRVVLNYLVIAALALSAAFTSCGGGSGSRSSGKIMITTESKDFWVEIAGSGVVTVDWGDGTEKVTRTLYENNTISFSQGYPNATTSFEHDYPNETIRTVTINGENIKWVYIRRYITSLDVSRCTELIYLKNVGGPLTSLDLSKNTALTVLILEVHKLTSLDVSKCTALTTLSCEVGELRSLDISKNTALTQLNCNMNKLTTLDVSKNTELKELYCNYNQLTSSAINALFGTLHSNAGEKTIVLLNNPGVKDCDRSIAERKGWRVSY